MDQNRITTTVHTKQLNPGVKRAWIEVSVDGEKVGGEVTLISGPTDDVDAYLEGTMTLEQVGDKWMNGRRLLTMTAPSGRASSLIPPAMGARAAKHERVMYEAQAAEDASADIECRDPRLVVDEADGKPVFAGPDTGWMK